MVAPKLSYSSTPLGVSRSLRLDEPKNSLTPPNHSISNHLWSESQVCGVLTGCLGPLWVCSHALEVSGPLAKANGTEHSKGLQFPFPLPRTPTWPVFNGLPGRFLDFFWDKDSSQRLGYSVPIAPQLWGKHWQCGKITTSTKGTRSFCCLY